MEDMQIIDLFWQRDETAIREAGGKYQQYCFKIAWNILYSREDSEECVNDTWLAAWSYIPPGKPKRLSIFLGKITRGFAIDCLRRKCAGKRVDTHMEDIAGELENLDQAMADTTAQWLDKQELLKVINQFLRHLSEVDRDIFVRRYWYTDSIRDIAARHGISEGNVKSRLFRIRKKLQREIEGETAEGRRRNG